MYTLIETLDSKSQKKLEKEYATLKALEKRPAQATREDIHEIYGAILKYLHFTYLSEVTKGIIPASTLKPTVKVPEVKKYGKVLSPEV